MIGEEADSVGVQPAPDWIARYRAYVSADAIDYSPGPLRGAVELIRRTVRDSINDRVPGLSAEVAFYVMLALQPLLLIVLGVAGYIAQLLGPELVMDIRTAIVSGAGTFLTTATIDSLTDPLDALLESGRADIVTIGVIFLLWSSSRAADVIIRTIMIAYDRPNPPAWLKRRVIALGMTFGGALGAGLLLPLLVLGPQFGASLAANYGWEGAFERIWGLAYWPVVALIGLVVLTWMYHLVVPHTPWRRELPGASLALIIWILGSFALRFYTTSFIEGDSAYGLFAVPLVVMLWLYVTAVALLVGAELNGEIEKLWPSKPAGA